MKKKSEQTTSDPGEKSIFRKAGEMIGSLGAHIVLAKESMVDFVSDEVEVVKKTAGNIAKKVSRTITKKPAKKAAPKKKATRRAETKKAAPKKKLVKKAVPKKKTAKKADAKRVSGSKNKSTSSQK